MKFEIIENIDHSNLKNIWSVFEEKDIPEGFEFKRLLHWWREFRDINSNKIGRQKRLKIIVGYESDTPILILPLVLSIRKKQKFLNIRYLEFLSQSFSFHELDIISKDLQKATIEELFEFIRKNIKYDVINLSYLNDNSPLIKYSSLQKMYHSGKVIIPISENYEEIRKNGYSKNLRHVLNKFNRRIKELDEVVKFDVITDREKIIEIKDQIFSVSNSKTRDFGMHSIYNNTFIGNAYFENIINKPNPYCAVIYFENQLVSYNYGYFSATAVYAMDAAYNRKFADAQKIGMGILAYDMVVQYFAKKKQIVDMGFGLDDYKFRFSKQLQISYTLYGFSHSIRSKIVSSKQQANILSNHNRIKSVFSKYPK
jgi:hypothetical protein